jgi:hypothetical protein
MGRLLIFASSTATLWGRSARGAFILCCFRSIGKERTGRLRPPPLPPGEGEVTAASAHGSHRQGPPKWGRGCIWRCSWRILPAGRPEEAVPPELGMATSVAASIANRVVSIVYAVNPLRARTHMLGRWSSIGPGPFPGVVQN